MNAPAKYPNNANPAIFFSIPEKINFFHSHCCNACGRTNDEATASRSGTIGNKFPEIMIRWVSLHIIHSHCCSNQWNIINNSRQEPDGNYNDIDITNRIYPYKVARSDSKCVDSNAAIATRIPRKKRTLGTSAFLNACTTE